MSAEQKVDDEFGDFFTALGVAMLAWQEVEGQLAWLFLCLLTPNVQMNEAAMTPLYVHHALTGAGQKLLVVDAAGRAALTDHPATLLAWEELHKKIGSAAVHRNALAHGVYQPDAEQKHAIGSHPMRQIIRRTARVYNVPRLRQLALEFSSLAEECMKFSIIAADKHPGLKVTRRRRAAAQPG